MSLKPEELFQAFADAVTDVCKRPFRPEPITQQEWAGILDRIRTLALMNGYGVSAQPSANQEEKKS